MSDMDWERRGQAIERGRFKEKTNRTIKGCFVTIGCMGMLAVLCVAAVAYMVQEGTKIRKQNVAKHKATIDANAVKAKAKSPATKHDVTISVHADGTQFVYVQAENNDVGLLRIVSPSARSDSAYDEIAIRIAKSLAPKARSILVSIVEHRDDLTTWRDDMQAKWDPGHRYATMLIADKDSWKALDN